MKTHNRPNVTQAMSILRLQYHWTLQEIADIFGVTREGVRQRVGNSGRIPLPSDEARRGRVWPGMAGQGTAGPGEAGHISPPSEGRGRKSPPKADDANQTVALQALRATVHILDPRFITDGFGNLWNAKCPTCGGKMSVVRPGDARCEVCG